MNIDLESMTEEELIELNQRIVSRLRFLREVDAHYSMMEFKIGDRVMFQPPGQAPLTGVLIRYNRKSVSVQTDSGGRWTVAPQLLKPAPNPK
jgi:hypothetical protein